MTWVTASLRPSTTRPSNSTRCFLQDSRSIQKGRVKRLEYASELHQVPLGESSLLAGYCRSCSIPKKENLFTCFQLIRHDWVALGWSDPRLEINVNHLLIHLSIEGHSMIKRDEQ